MRGREPSRGDDPFSDPSHPPVCVEIPVRRFWLDPSLEKEMQVWMFD
jgi:hypothetical protein